MPNARAYYKSTPGASQRKIVGFFEIKQTVLCWRLNGKKSSSKSDRKPALSEEDKNMLAAILVELSELVDGLTKNDKPVLMCDYSKENFQLNNTQN